VKSHEIAPLNVINIYMPQYKGNLTFSLDSACGIKGFGLSVQILKKQELRHWLFSPLISSINMAWELIGYLGGFLIAVSLLPQLIKSWRTKSVEDIALLWTVVSLIGLLLYFIYATKNTILPLMLFAAIEAVMIVILITLKLKYGKTKKDDEINLSWKNGKNHKNFKRRNSRDKQKTWLRRYCS